MTSEETSKRTAEQERVFKKASPNQKLILYLSSRDLVVSPEGIDRLQGVLLVDPEFVEDKKVYGQVTLTFRYGREDEEVMGLKFCNEAIMCLAQLYPPHPEVLERVTPLQEALIKRLGPNAFPFTLEITPLAPPSVQLVPAKEYNGSPIGTSYDVRAYVAEKVDEKLHRRSTVRMGIRVVQKAYPPPSPYLYQPGCNNCGETKPKSRRTLLFISKKQVKSIRRPDEPDPGARAAAVLGEVYNEGPSHRFPKPGIKKDYRSSCLTEDANISNGPNEEQAEAAGDANRLQTCMQPDDGGGECEENKTEEGDRSKPPPRSGCCSICDIRRASLAAYIAKMPPPRAVTEKYCLLSDGRIRLITCLDKAIYGHGESIRVTVQIRNDSSRTIKQIKIFVVQHVDVCMFSNGKFKNIVAMMNAKEDCPVEGGTSMEKTYSLLPVKSTTKNWIALEESYNKSGTSLASTVTSATNNQEERNVFAIYVSYYVKVKLSISLMGGEVCLKLPFTLMHTCSNSDPNSETLSRVKPDVRLSLKNGQSEEADVQHEASNQEKPLIEPEKDGT